PEIHYNRLRVARQSKRRGAFPCRSLGCGGLTLLWISRSPARSPGFGGRVGRRFGQVVEQFTLHPFDFGPVASCDERQLLWTAADPQSRQQVEEIRNPLLRHFQFLFVPYHGEI